MHKFKKILELYETKKLVIVDYGIGNLKSLEQVIKYFGITPLRTKEKNIIMDASHLILPGVGAFGHCVDKLDEFNLIEIIKDYIDSEKYFLGICVGMQLLFSRSFEFGENYGLNIMKGDVIKISSNKFENKMKLPHIGWNKVFHPLKKEVWKKSIFEDFDNYFYQYFVHSYYPEVEDKSNIIGYINYYDQVLPVAVKKNNVYGFQFHPEKSGRDGLKIVENFLKLDVNEIKTKP